MKATYVPCAICGGSDYMNACRWDEDEGTVDTCICKCGEEYDEEDVKGVTHEKI